MVPSLTVRRALGLCSWWWSGIAEDRRGLGVVGRTDCGPAKLFRGQRRTSGGEHCRESDRVKGEWQESRIKRAFAEAVRAADPTAARESIQAFTAFRYPHVREVFAQRLWQVAFAYGEISRTGHAKRQIGQAVRVGVGRREFAPTTVWLQEWGKPHHCVHKLLTAGLSDLTCEAIITEFPENFLGEVVAAAKKLLAAHEDHRFRAGKAEVRV